MASKSVEDLQGDLSRLKEREARLKEELALKKKAADARAQKELARKKFRLADIFVEQFGEGILDHRDELEFFVSNHVSEISVILSAYGYQE